MANYVCVFGNLAINDGPLKGKRYAEGHGSFFYLDAESRMLHCYAAYCPPWKRLRRRSAYYVSHSVGPLRRRDMRLAKECGPHWKNPETKR